MSYDNYIIVGKVLTTHGIKGFLTIRTFTALPSDTFKYKLYVKIDDKYKYIKIEKYNFMPKKTIMKIDGIDSIEDCQDYIGLDLLVPKQDLPKTESDEYYWYELIGSVVINHKGIELGQVEDIFTSGENDVLIIKGKLSNNEILIPFLKDNIISLQNNILKVKWDNEI